MDVSYCRHCGAALEETAQNCTACGAIAQQKTDGENIESDPRFARVRELLARARAAQQAGDLSSALRDAREALSLRSDCSTIHALLGHLYEQSGDSAASRYHFQAALSVTTAAEPECPVFTVAPASPASHALGGGVTLVLIGCILFSAMALFLSLWIGERPVDQGAIFQASPHHPVLSVKPVWTGRVPSPLAAPTSREQAETPVPLPPTATGPVEAVSELSQTPSRSPERVEPVALPESALGPNASSRVPAEPIQPTLEQADKAYFIGQYERAASLYEELLRDGGIVNPRVQRDLALCYHQLGDSRKAAEHLSFAVQGYEIQALANPQDATVQQELRSCQAALRVLSTASEQAQAP